MADFKCGFVTILGEPNAGKSTLINRLVGEKVAIVTPKPQTTRDNTIGIYNDADSQIIFLDTPGVHKSANKIDEYMDKNIKAASRDTDILLYVLSAKKDLQAQFAALDKNSDDKIKKIVLINKIDDTTYEKLYPKIAEFAKSCTVKDILPISALKGKNCDVLIDLIKSYLPSFKVETRYYPLDQYTDKSSRFIAGETIREKILLIFNEEIPHGTAVQINSFSEDDKLIRISADIICERESHKKIILGLNGAAIKKLATMSRESIEKQFLKKVFLELFVKVRKNWRDDRNYCKLFGYELKKDKD